MNEGWWVKRDQLDPQQQAVMGLGLKASHLLLGPPGSGKTNLLLLRAAYLSRMGKKDLAVIVYTRTLKEFLEIGSSLYSLPPDRAMTSIGWAHDLLKRYGESFRPSSNLSFEEHKKQVLERVQAMVSERKLERVFDAILLDEAQDYSPTEIDLFRQLADVLFAAADPKQKIFDGEDSIETLKKACGGVSTLKFHYRNGPAICRLADRLNKEDRSHERLESCCNYPETLLGPSTVEVIGGKTVEEQAQVICEALRFQIKAYPGALLGVMTPRREELRTIMQVLSKSDLADLAALQLSGDHQPFSPERPICLTTMHSGKGLEFRALHIAGTDHLKSFELQRNMIFTAVTRAKTTLRVLYHRSIPGFLEKALSTEPSTLISLDQLFSDKVRS